MAYISLFKNLKNSNPVLDIPITGFYEDVINGEYKIEVEAIRSTTDPVKRKILKTALAAVTISGTFKERKIEASIKHSERICIDIDSKQNPFIENWADLRTTLGSWKEVEFSALSASGQGAFVVIVISTPENHLEHFKALERSFKKLGIIIDSSCKDIPRLRYMSYDSDAIHNVNVTPFQLQYREPEYHYEPDKNSIQTGEDIGLLVKRIVKDGIDITDSYVDWFAIGCALANEFGEHGRYHFHRLSQLNSGYKPSECDRQFDKCLRHNSGYTRATFYWIAKNHGITINRN